MNMRLYERIRISNEPVEKVGRSKLRLHHACIRMSKNNNKDES